MKILLFSTDYWPNPGGIAAHVHYLAHSLNDAGAHLTLIGGHKTTFHKEFIKRNNEIFNEIVIKRITPKYLRSILFIIMVKKELLSLKKEQFDIIHFHNFLLDGLFFGILPFQWQCHTIFTNHSTHFIKRYDEGKNLKLFKFLIRSVDGIITVSRELLEKTKIVFNNKKKIIYIPNGVDCNLFRPVNYESYFDKLGLDKNIIAIVSSRRHDYKSGLEYLVGAMPQIVSRHSNVILLLAGEGEQTKNLKNLVNTLNLNRYVKFLGHVPHNELPYIYSMSYISILPSLYEGMSLSGLESLACGVPVIGTKVGGMPEFVIPGETGFLVEPKNIDALAEVILYMLDNPNVRNRMAMHCRDFALNNFSWSIVAQKTLEFYKTVKA